MRVRIVTAIAVAAMLVIAVTSVAQASEVGCYTAEFIWDDDGINGDMIVLEADEGVEHSYVGDYAWIRFDGLETNERKDWTYDNVVSYHIPWGSVDQATICTTYWDGSKDTIEVEDVEEIVQVVQPATEAEATVVVVGTQSYDGWLLEGGWIAL